MAVVVVGVDHRTVPIDVLERMLISSDRLPDLLTKLQKSDHIAESVVLSTCLRTEVYVEAVRFHGAVQDIHELIASTCDLDPAFLLGAFYQLHDDAAFAHLFRVASGLESAVAGEAEVLGQVARAWEGAREIGACKSILGGLFRHAVETGKRARTETSIARGITSIGQSAVAMAERHIGGISDKCVLVVGAGEMGDSMTVALSCTDGVENVLVTNRTQERARLLAQRVNGRDVPFDELRSLLPAVDLVLSSTGSPEPVLTAELISEAMNGRGDRPLVIVDVAMPRDVEPSVQEIPGVTVLGMSDLRSFADAGRVERASEVWKVEAIIAEEVERYSADVAGRLVVPIVRRLRERAEVVRQAELSRHRVKLDALDEYERDLVENMTTAMMNKLLHDPTVRLKDAAGTPEGERMAEALRLLFGI